jgi:hypothetical protein
MAMATACFRLRTFLPEPLFSVPFLCSCITLWTFFFCVVVAMNCSAKTEVAPFEWTVCQLTVYVLVMTACMSAS